MAGETGSEGGANALVLCTHLPTNDVFSVAAAAAPRPPPVLLTD